MKIHFLKHTSRYRAFCLPCFWCIGAFVLHAQLYIGPGATLHLDQYSRITVQETDFTNAGTFNMNNGADLRMQGVADQSLTTGGAVLQILEVDKGGGLLHLLDNCTVAGELDFNAPGSRIVLGANNLVFGSAAGIYGLNSDAYLVTDNTGVVTKQGLGASAFSFPVGNDVWTYNPLTISENGTVDAISVRCLAAPLSNGSTGSALTADVVNTAWEVSEAVAGNSNLYATAEWTITDELTGFDWTDCGIARFNTGIDWDLPPASMGTSTGIDPYVRIRSGLTPGIWMVADEARMNRVLISAKIMLQGAFNSTTGKMNDNLRSLVAFPLTAPATYSTGKFVPTGWQPAAGFTINPSVLTVTGDNAIVDWVFLSLRNIETPSVLAQTRVALLQKDGDIVELNGIDPVKMPGNATQNYILGVGHRNHLSVRTPNGSGLNFSESSTTAYDFTTALTQAYGANPMKQVQTIPTEIYALWGGNANENTTVRASGPSSVNDYSTILTVLGTATILTNVYSKADLNLDGTVRASGPTTVNDYSRLLNYLGTSTLITEQN